MRFFVAATLKCEDLRRLKDCSIERKIADKSQCVAKVSEMLESECGESQMSVFVFKYGAGRKGGEATERAKNKFASAGGGERSGTGWERASVVARGAWRRYLLMYPGFDQSGVATPISLCGGTCLAVELARSRA